MLKICLFCLFIAPICSRAEHKSALVDNPSFLADALISASVLSSPSTKNCQPKLGKDIAKC